ncbi:MAG TPA: molybdopterin molybdotransferase MoeA [Mycobacteriales bacterium]|nr:molybdopterin molybdotransferase MoeA [Mycobacteriales bacterium]
MRAAWAEARQTAYEAVRPVPPVEATLAEAEGGTLADSMRAGTPLPGFDCSAMDGYAVPTPEGPWRVVGRALAGPATERPPLAPGTTVEIATGAAVPPGTVAVLPYEHASREGDRVTGTAFAGKNVRRSGEDVPLGTDLLPAGTPVTPAVIGLAAAVGLDTLTVRPRPVAALLITGDEIVQAGGSHGGLVRDALGPALPGWVRGLGGRLLPPRRVADTEVGDVAGVIASAPGDLVLTCGGAGGGPKDLVVPALRSLGAQVLVDKVNCRPGGPQRLAVLPDGRPVVVLPGYPYAALVGVLTVLGPLLAGLTGRALPDPPTAELVGGAPNMGGRPQLPGRPTAAPTRILPVRRRPDGAVEAVGLDRPGSLWGAALADAFAIIPPDWRGEPVGLLTPPG